MFLAKGEGRVERNPSRDHNPPKESKEVKRRLLTIPPHAPAPGHECCSRSSMTSLGVRPFSPGLSAALSLL
jgi:hypothetical protein